MPIAFEHVYLRNAAYFMPGEPVDNAHMDDFIAPLNRISGRIKQRILSENGIQQRYYAIDAQGTTTHTNALLAANAIRQCLANAQMGQDDISLLVSGSSGGDALMPGFANMIQGELHAPPMETASIHGICAAGVSAIQAVAQGIELGAHQSGIVVASELPSRLFKRSRFAARGYDTDFDSHFLRWMLSDGAGALLLSRDNALGAPIVPGLKIRLKWVHQRSFSGDYPVCMQLGLSADRQRGHLDYPSWQAAEADGALSLRQDIRLLPHLFDIGIHEYVKLVNDGWLQPEKISHFLCHYSSEKFIPVVEDLMKKAGLAIPRERWYSNLAWRGNTGAASILIMLAEFLQSKQVAKGEQIFCYVPESGRFMAAYMLFEVEQDEPSAVTSVPQTASRDTGGLTQQAAQQLAQQVATRAYAPASDNTASSDWIAPPHDAASAPAGLGKLLTELGAIWHDYRSNVWRTPLVSSLRERRFATPDYIKWMGDWIPQVRQGTQWMRKATAGLSEQYAPLAALITLHAGEEQDDFKILYSDYRKAGGTIEDIDALQRNPGGEALNAYLHALAATPDAIGLLGAIYIIEGTGQRIIPALLPLLKASLALPPDAFRFLEYHGQNDEHHLERWLVAVSMALDCDQTGTAEKQIIDTARRTAAMYLMQFQYAKQQDIP